MKFAFAAVSLMDAIESSRAFVVSAAFRIVSAGFTGGRDGSLWYYDALAGVFETHLPGPASARLRKLVLEMHALAASDEVEQGEIELRSEGH